MIKWCHKKDDRPNLFQVAYAVVNLMRWIFSSIIGCPLPERVRCEWRNASASKSMKNYQFEPVHAHTHTLINLIESLSLLHTFSFSFFSFRLIRLVRTLIIWKILFFDSSVWSNWMLWHFDCKPAARHCPIFLP